MAITDSTEKIKGTVEPAAAPAATRQVSRSKLGEILVRSGAINQQQLDHAIGLQKQLKLPIGQVLLKLNYLTDEALRHALSAQLNVAFVDLDRTTIDKNIARYISRTYAKKHQLVPVAQFGRTLTVAMDDPTNRAVAEELQRLTSFTITVVTATSDAIQRTWLKLYEAKAPAAPSAAPVTPAIVSRADQFQVQFDEQSSWRADDLFGQIVNAGDRSEAEDLRLELLRMGLTALVVTVR